MKHILWRKHWRKWDAALCPTISELKGRHKVTLSILPKWIDEKWIWCNGIESHNVSVTGLWGWFKPYIIKSAGFAILVYSDGRNKIRHRRIVDRIRVSGDGVIVGWFGVKFLWRWWRICPFTMEAL